MEHALTPPDKSDENPARILVCVSDADHSRVAVRFAAARLKHRGGRLDMLYVLQPADFQSFSMIADRIEEENRAKGEAVLQAMAEEAADWSGATPTLILREGKVSEQILEVLEASPDINLLVMGAAPSAGSRREVVTELVQQLGRRLFVPMLVVPGHLTDQQILELT